jgi:hypothetical protein
VVDWFRVSPLRSVSVTGFTRIFNGKNIDGRHISRTTHHGATGSNVVKGGELLMQPFGQGGLLQTDKAQKDFDLSRELIPNAGFNSGIFLRSTESGCASMVPGRAARSTSVSRVCERFDR